MTDSEQSYGEWLAEPGAFAIRYPLGLLHEIDFNVKDAARRISHGGMETGGFLFGRTVTEGDRETVNIDAFRAIDCEHAFGPSFVLSESDLAKMREQLLQAGSDPGLEGMRLLGWFIGHARNPLRLNDHEASLFDRLFPRPGQLTLLMKPERFAPSQVALIVRARDRKVDRDGTKIAFPLPPMVSVPPHPQPEVPEPAPVLSVPPVPAATVAELPEALELGLPSPQTAESSGTPIPTRRKLLWATKDKPAEDKAPQNESVSEESPIEGPPNSSLTNSPPSSPTRGLALPNERPAKEIPQESGLISLDELRARRLQRLERSEVVEQPAHRSEELSAPPPSFALMQDAKAPLRIPWPLVAALLVLILGGVGYWFHEHYFAPAVPLAVDDRTDKLMVFWPAEATRGAGEASIRVDDAAPIPLSEEEKVLGRAEVSRPGDDVQVELVIHHFFYNARGRVRFVKPVMTAKP